MVKYSFDFELNRLSINNIQKFITQNWIVSVNCLLIGSSGIATNIGNVTLPMSDFLEECEMFTFWMVALVTIHECGIVDCINGELRIWKKEGAKANRRNFSTVRNGTRLNKVNSVYSLSNFEVRKFQL